MESLGLSPQLNPALLQAAAEFCSKFYWYLAFVNCFAICKGLLHPLCHLINKGVLGGDARWDAALWARSQGALEMGRKDGEMLCGARLVKTYWNVWLEGFVCLSSFAKWPFIFFWRIQYPLMKLRHASLLVPNSPWPEEGLPGVHLPWNLNFDQNHPKTWDTDNPWPWFWLLQNLSDLKPDPMNIDRMSCVH